MKYKILQKDIYEKIDGKYFAKVIKEYAEISQSSTQRISELDKVLVRQLNEITHE